MKQFLTEMTALGGRDSEKDLFGNPGRYQTKLSSKTAGLPCPACSTLIVKETFLGGSVYFCPTCQAL